MNEKLWEIPESWEWAKISDLGNVVSGGTPSTKNPAYWNGEINWISPADLTGYEEKYISSGSKSITEEGLKNSSARLMPKGAVLFSSRAPVGYVAVAGSELSTNQGFKSIVPSSGLGSEFVYYYLKASKSLAESRASGTTFKELSGKAFSNLPVAVAPVKEQRRIVAKIEELFSELDKGVESLKTARAQLKTYRQSLLKAAFEGRLTEQWRCDNADKLETADQLLQRIREECETRYQQQLEEWKIAVAKWEADGKVDRKPTKPKPATMPHSDDIGCFLGSKQLPAGWSITKLKYLMRKKPQNGRSVKTRKGGFPVLRLTALGNRVLDLSERKDGAWEYDEAKPYLVEERDFLLARGNGSKSLVGRGSLAKDVTEDIAFPDTMIRVSPDQEFLYAPYLNLLWASSFVRSQIEGKARTTAGIYKINQEHIANIDTPVPHCMEEQREIVRLVESQLSQVDKLEETITDAISRAEALRQSILKRAFEGKLVPQEPDDESASALLERIRQEQAETPKPKRRKRKTEAPA